MLFDIYGPTRGTLSDMKKAPGVTILGWTILIGVYVVLWWIVNAIFGNATPSLWDFIWQNFLFASIMTAIFGTKN